MKGLVPDRDLREVLKTPLDEHSHYISPADKTKFDNDLNQELVGIGILQAEDPKTKSLLVLSPVPDGPAVDAGVCAADRIVKIDGQSTKGMSLKDSSARIKGQAGTSVTISVEHPHAAQPADITIVRRLFHEETVEGASARFRRAMELPPAGQVANRLRPDHGLHRRRRRRQEHRRRLSRGAGATAQRQSSRARAGPSRQWRRLVERGHRNLRHARAQRRDRHQRGRDGRVMRAYAASGRARFTGFPIAVLVNGYTPAPARSSPLVFKTTAGRLSPASAATARARCKRS